MNININKLMDEIAQGLDPLKKDGFRYHIDYQVRNRLIRVQVYNSDREWVRLYDPYEARYNCNARSIAEHIMHECRRAFQRSTDYQTYYSKAKYNPLDIKDVIFNDPATIVFWKDGTKTVVKAQDGEPFDPEKGLAMAIAKKALGNQGNYYNVFTKWCPEEDEEVITADKVRWSNDNHEITGTINLNAAAVESLKKLGKAAQEVGFIFTPPKPITSLKDLK